MGGLWRGSVIMTKEDEEQLRESQDRLKTMVATRDIFSIMTTCYQLVMYKEGTLKETKGVKYTPKLMAHIQQHLWLEVQAWKLNPDSETFMFELAMLQMMKAAVELRSKEPIGD